MLECAVSLADASGWDLLLTLFVVPALAGIPEMYPEMFHLKLFRLKLFRLKAVLQTFTTCRVVIDSQLRNPTNSFINRLKLLRRACTCFEERTFQASCSFAPVQC